MESLKTHLCVENVQSVFMMMNKNIMIQMLMLVCSISMEMCSPLNIPKHSGYLYVLTVLAVAVFYKQSVVSNKNHPDHQISSPAIKISETNQNLNGMRGGRKKHQWLKKMKGQGHVLKHPYYLVFSPPK